MSACSTCGLDAVVQWRRRPTPDEVAQMQAAVRERGTGAGRPAVVRPPTAADSFIAVYACVDHAVSPASAARIHQATCVGPGRTGNCPCTPEPPDHSPFPDPGSQRRLPPGW